MNGPALVHVLFYDHHHVGRPLTFPWTASLVRTYIKLVYPSISSRIQIIMLLLHLRI